MGSDDRSMMEVFRRYDTDGDGYLTRDDFRAHADRICERLDLPEGTPKRRRLHDAYAELWRQLSTVADVDRSGGISAQEYLAAMVHNDVRGDEYFRASTLQAVNALADALDTDGDGSLDPAEYQRIFAATGIRPGTPGMAFADLDADGDGRLSRVELLAAVTALFPLASPNWLNPAGDGGPRCRGVALVAHDARKPDLLSWAKEHAEALATHRLYGTGTTGHLIADNLGLPIEPLRSGPLGGDQQIGARIVEGEIDLLVFFWDPLTSHPHQDDVKALLRLAIMANVPVACNRATADLVITSPAMAGPVATPA